MRLFRRGEADPSVDLLVAGLGNPGPEHARDRHNVGWMVVDELARRHAGSFKGKFRGRLADVRLEDAKLALLKPETYMNDSGASIRSAAAFYKLAPVSVLVVHDDVDLEVGRLQARLGGGLAGHNGLRSIAQRLGSQEFLRVRIAASRRRLRALGLRGGGRRRGDRRPRGRCRRVPGRRGARRDAAPLQLRGLHRPVRSAAHIRHERGTHPWRVRR